MWLKSLVVIQLFSSVLCSDVCPKQCDCDMDNGLYRAICVGQNIISIDVGVPRALQVYSLSHNSISELDNFCFKEAGYTDIHVLNLSNNLIFWVGLHAFSGLDSLVHLDLSNNRIRFIPSDLFWDTPQLESLDLSGNVFEVIKNEPFLMHNKLQILNLNNCRIKSLPNRVFSRLPSLKKLDLSENYMVSLNTEVLRPMRKLERLEIRNDYWQCSPDFMALEAWIAAQSISYDKQCRKKSPKMSEKIISLVKIEDKEPVDIANVWNVTRKNDTLPKVHSDRPPTLLEKFDKKFPASQALLLGLEIGLAIGIIGTYIWLRSLCCCGRLSCSRPQTARRRRLARRRIPENDMRTTLLWNSVINPDLETPPLFRRVLPDGGTPFGLPITSGTSIQADAIRVPDRAETPPPPYNECRINI